MSQAKRSKPSLDANDSGLNADLLDNSSGHLETVSLSFNRRTLVKRVLSLSYALVPKQGQKTLTFVYLNFLFLQVIKGERMMQGSTCT